MMRPRMILILLGVGVAIVAAGCQRAAQQPPVAEKAAEGQVFDVVAKEFAFEPKEIKVKAGMVKFIVKNEGTVEHDFEIVGVAEHGGEHEQKLFKSGETYTVELELRPGTYQAVCNVPGHKEAGMVATVVVE